MPSTHGHALSAPGDSTSARSPSSPRWRATASASLRTTPLGTASSALSSSASSSSEVAPSNRSHSSVAVWFRWCSRLRSSSSSTASPSNSTVKTAPPRAGRKSATMSDGSTSAMCEPGQRVDEVVDPCDRVVEVPDREPVAVELAHDARQLFEREPTPLVERKRVPGQLDEAFGAPDRTQLGARPVDVLREDEEPGGARAGRRARSDRVGRHVPLVLLVVVIRKIRERLELREQVPRTGVERQWLRIRLDHVLPRSEGNRLVAEVLQPGPHEARRQRRLPRFRIGGEEDRVPVVRHTTCVAGDSGPRPRCVRIQRLERGAEQSHLAVALGCELLTDVERVAVVVRRRRAHLEDGLRLERGREAPQQLVEIAPEGAARHFEPNRKSESIEDAGRRHTRESLSWTLRRHVQEIAKEYVVRA